MREWNSGTDAKYRFTGKERDIETNYDYFGARYYDARIGRWGGVEPKYEGYISFSPYNYGGLNPMRFFDANGLDLFVGGDIGKAINDLRSLLPESEQYRISQIDSKVNSDTKGLDVYSDAAYELLNNLTNKSSQNFLYEVADKTSGVSFELVEKEILIFQYQILQELQIFQSLLEMLG
ncbi:MAG: RHS repeat-associated core domain-containing protein [Ignavibacteria bacterium]|nr:RHS repeat-associated core domain-containing protein [Ignavibacteria bacterium]